MYMYYSLDEGQLQFQDIVQNKQPFEISRTFAATLQLVSLEKIDELRGVTTCTFMLLHVAVMIHKTSMPYGPACYKME